MEQSELTPETMKRGGRYNWKGQPDRLIYLGRNWSGNGYWHQFEKIGDERPVWCEVVDTDLHMLEETVPMRCEPCRETGAIHCADPQNCGGPWTTPNAADKGRA